MKDEDIYMDRRTRELMKISGFKKTREGFTRSVMDKLEKEKRLYPYKKDNTLMHVLLAVGLPILYFLYKILAGGESFFTGLDLTKEFQPYIQLFHLISDKLIGDISSPIVPLGIFAIVLLLVFDRLILRSFSFK